MVIMPIMEFILLLKFSIDSYIIRFKRTDMERKLWYISYMFSKENYFREIKLNNIGNYFIDMLSSKQKSFIKTDIKILKKYKIWIFFVNLIEILIDVLIYVYLLISVIANNILIGDVFVFIKSINQSKNTISSLLEILTKISKDNLELDVFFSFIDMDSDKKNNILKEDILIDKIEKITIKNMSYNYKEDRKILQNINIEFENGKKYIIVGRNGSGKSTLLNLVMGFYDNYEGEILVNGFDLGKIDKSSYMKCISTLFQDFVKYEGTYRENIIYGDVVMSDDNDRLRKIVKKFDIESILNKKNDDIDSTIGYWFDNGTQISEGEWQKLSVARTFYKNSSLVILDEPNSYLDSISEEMMQKKIISEVSNKILIVVMHRFKRIALREDVRIIVMDNGRILNTGNHEFLMKTCEIYRNLYNAY